MPDKKIAMYDFSEGHYVVAYSGAAVKKGIRARIDQKENKIISLRETLIRELADLEVASDILIAMLGPSPGVRTCYIRGIVAEINKEYDDIAYLERLLPGLVPDAVYKLSPVELEKFGL